MIGSHRPNDYRFQRTMNRHDGSIFVPTKEGYMLDWKSVALGFGLIALMSVPFLWRLL